jgi:hypothetical protein
VADNVFISYSREDRPKVAKIAQALEGKGLRVWYDSKIQTGAGFRAEIAQALAAAKAVVVIWSRYSVASRFVCDEADEGVHRDILYPALIDAVDIPLGFRQIQTADLTRWNGRRMNDPALLAFIDTVSKGARGKLGQPPRPAPIPQPAPPPPSDPEPVQPAPAPRPKKEKPQKAKPGRAPKPPKDHAPRPEKAGRYTTTGTKLRQQLMISSLGLTALVAGVFAAIAYGSQFVFEAYRPAFVAGVAALAFLSRYGTFQGDRAFGAASTHLMSRSYVALLCFSLLLIAPLIMQGRIYAAALQGVQVRGIEGADINGVSLDLTGTRLLTSSDDGTVRVWDATTGVQRGQYDGHAAKEGEKPEDHWVWNAAFSPDGGLAVSASRDLTAQVWKTSIVAPLTTLRGHTRSVRDAAWQPQNEAVATSSNDGTVIIWEPESWEKVRALGGHGGGVNAIDFSSDGKLLASASDDGVIRVWDWRSGRLVNSAGAGGPALDVRFSHDGTMLVSTSEGRVRIFRVAGLQRLGEIQHGARAFSAVFVSGDKEVATSGVDGVVRIWSVADRTMIRELTGHKDAVRSLDSTPDGARLISGSRDNTARVWDVASGEEIQTMGHVKPALRLPMSLDVPPYLAASRAPVPMDFKANPDAALDLLWKGLLVAGALTLGALLLKSVLWVVRLRPLARLALVAALFGVAVYAALIMVSALPIEALWLWLTAGFVPAAILATVRWLSLGVLASGRGRSRGGAHAQGH